MTDYLTMQEIIGMIKAGISDDDKIFKTLEEIPEMRGYILSHKLEILESIKILREVIVVEVEAHSITVKREGNIQKFEIELQAIRPFEIKPNVERLNQVFFPIDGHQSILRLREMVRITVEGDMITCICDSDQEGNAKRSLKELSRDCLKTRNHMTVAEGLAHVKQKHPELAESYEALEGEIKE